MIFSRRHATLHLAVSVGCFGDQFIHQYVGQFVGPKYFLNWERFLHWCPCPTISLYCRVSGFVVAANKNMYFYNLYTPYTLSKILHYNSSGTNDDIFYFYMTSNSKNFSKFNRFCFFFFFLGSGPKGPMSWRTQGSIFRRPSILPSICPSVRLSICFPLVGC